MSTTPTAPDRLARTKSLFAELQKEKDALVAQYQKYRDYYETAMSDPKLAEARSKIKEFNAKAGPLDNELAHLARALGTKSLSSGA